MHYVSGSHQPTQQSGRFYEAQLEVLRRKHRQHWHSLNILRKGLVEKVQNGCCGVVDNFLVSNSAVSAAVCLLEPAAENPTLRLNANPEVSKS